MKYKIIISFFFLFYQFIVFGQIDGDTIFFKKTEIRVYTYLVEKDTIVKVYIDKNTSRHKSNNNLRKRKFHKILDYIRLKYPYNSVTTAELNSAKLIEFDKNIKPNFSSSITRDCYWIGAINFYTKEIENDSNDYSNYYSLATALYEFYGTYSLKHDKVISYLNSSIQLKSDYEDAYFLKAKVYERNGIMKGLMISESNIIVDTNEIQKALKCLDELLRINSNNADARKYKEELLIKYKNL